MMGQPLRYMKNGELTGCGLRIIGGRPLGQGIELSEISLNFYPSGRAVLKAIAYAPSRPAESLEKVKEKRVQSAWIKATGTRATPVLSAALPGDNKLSLLFVTDTLAGLAIIEAQQKGEPIQMAVRRAGEQMESVLAGPIRLEPAESRQLSECMGELGVLMERSAEAPGTEPRKGAGR